jgi:hypothetical protein
MKDKDLDRDETNRDANRDPITGAPGSHPVGTGVGAAITGAAAGVAGGALGGPAGMIAGAAIGAVAGGYAGKAVEETFDPTAEEAYWRTEYGKRPYVDQGADYETYAPAYRYGWESRSQHPGRRFDDVENDLAQGWHRTRGNSNLGWDKAKLAARDAWDHVERAMPGDADRDGR